MDQTITWRRPDAKQPEWDLTVVRPEPATTADLSFGDLGEADLVAACLRGQTGAFDVIVERHRRAVYQLCYRFVGNHEDASDLAQDVFLRAYRGLRNFGGRSSLATWLYRIGVNVCLNRISAKKPQSEPIEARQHVDTRTPSPSEQLIGAERDARVRAAIAQLPRKQRVALILRMYHEMSHQEIADVVGSSVGAVKANVFHALQNLKKRLAGETA
jgi:RNA polymerase sigma-70 factor (ECF subfamily)